MASASTPLPPACAARYAPRTVLGEGGFASVWLAEQVELAREVVVKVLHADALDTPEHVERFRNEARITASLSHPHVVILIDHGVDDGVPWIAYEHLPRGTLARAIARGPLPWRDAVACAAQIASALRAAHAAGVLHRDIKPANVLEAAPGVWKVADFGVAKWTQASTVKTREGLVVGSPAYLAPELLVGAPASPRTDLYALGLVLFQMLAGQLPPRGAAAQGAPSAALTALAREAGRTPPPPPVLAALDRALALDPERRWASAAELGAALEALTRDPEPARARRAGAPARAAPRLALASLALCGALLAIAFVAPGNRRGPTREWTPLPDASRTATPAPSPAAPADLLRELLALYQAALPGGRRALWGWRGDRPGLAETARAVLAADHTGAVGARLLAALEPLEASERRTPLYWAVRGLARGASPPGRDVTDLDPRSLAALHDAYTGLYLALDARPLDPGELAQVTLLLTERQRSWRPANALFDEEWDAWRVFHLHHALDLVRGRVSPDLRLMLEARLAALEPPPPAPAPAPALPLTLDLPATPELAAFRGLVADPAHALAALNPLELGLALRAGKRALDQQRPPGVPAVDRWLDALAGWGASRPEYWLLLMSWLAECDRTPEARTAYLRGLDRWFHRAPPRAVDSARALHERFLEIFLARLVSAETVGTHGEFGVAMDFATQVESSLRGTRTTEESMTSLQRAASCAHLELLAGDPAQGGLQGQRAFAKAQLYRATLVSRATHPWLLASAHDRAEQAMERLGSTLSAERGEAMRAELIRLRALRKQARR